ncbi:hypothetical protein QNH14_02850 [Apirhabdus apintestini]|nr:hypothetical protein QNH14_02850 [Enterobacteriaceae bacterium CA-0114]
MLNARRRLPGIIPCHRLITAPHAGIVIIIARQYAGPIAQSGERRMKNGSAIASRFNVKQTGKAVPAPLSPR